MRVQSSDDVSVAIHDFGGTGRPLLFSHATGFHAHCYRSIASRLSDSFASTGFDHRGHGDTPRPDDWQVDWNGYGDDATAAAAAVAPDGGLIAFGHSMGGASLVMAALRRPELFDLIIAFEPIIFPQRESDSSGETSPLVAGARNRRSRFDSFDAAIANYASKPPMRFFDPEILRDYVEHGFTPVHDGAGDDDDDDGVGVELRCAPEHEARTFETGGTHTTHERLGDVQTRIIVVAGHVDTPMSPAGIAHGIADRLPNGSYIELPEGNHLTPFTDPAATAQLIRDAI